MTSSYLVSLVLEFDSFHHLSCWSSKSVFKSVAFINDFSTCLFSSGRRFCSLQFLNLVTKLKVKTHTVETECLIVKETMSYTFFNSGVREAVAQRSSVNKVFLEIS